MSVGVAINKNVFIQSVEKTDKRELKIEFAEYNPELSDNPLALLSGSTFDYGSSSMTITLFSMKVPDDTKMKTPLTSAKKTDMVIKDINGTREVLEHLLEGFIPASEAFTGTVVYEATGLEKDNFYTKILEQGTLNQITDNLYDFFIKKLKDAGAIGDTSRLFRLKLTRTSKDKHFATLPTKHVKEFPAWESMDIPDAESQVKWSKYELDNGLNDPTPTAKTSADPKGSAAGSSSSTPSSAVGAPQDAAKLFGE